jgi:hypothetical protein
MSESSPYSRVDLAFLDSESHPSNRPNFDNEYGPDGWPQNNTSFRTYCFDGERLGLRNVYETIRTRLTILGRTGMNVALDLAGGRDGIALQDLIRDGLVAQGILTNLIDKRSDDVRDNPNLPIAHIAGDLVERETCESIVNKARELAPNGLALISWQPGRVALSNLSSTFYKGGAHACLDMLRPGGVFLGEIPPALLSGPDLADVCASIQQRSDVERVDAAIGAYDFGSTLILKSFE